eukprot:3645565-Prymnesium_polylepis.1
MRFHIHKEDNCFPGMLAETPTSLVRSLLIARIDYGSSRRQTPSLLPAMSLLLAIAITRFARISSLG